MKNIFFILFLGLTTLTFVGCAETNDGTEIVHTKACTIDITGMMCEKGCKTTIQNRINDMEGVVEGDVDYSLGKAFVTYDANLISSSDIISMIESIGDGLYSASLVEEKDIENAPVSIESNEETQSASVSSYTFEVPDISWLFSELL